VNLVLFEPGELAHPLRADDRRAQHVTSILRRVEGDEFDAGIIGGPIGKARITRIDADAIELEFRPVSTGPPLHPITLIVGLSRPQSSRDILRDATSLGVARLVFAPTARGERSYAQSRLWTSGEYRRHLVLGAEQAFSTELPETLVVGSLAEALSSVAGRRFETGMVRVALDNYESEGSLSAILRAATTTVTSVCLAVGSERGWSAEERSLLRDKGFRPADLGNRVLRTETALVAGVSVALAALRRL
jgi:16S rRNA (uracil1498-N3)-methyltransferase